MGNCYCNEENFVDDKGEYRSNNQFYYSGQRPLSLSHSKNQLSIIKEINDEDNKTVGLMAQDSKREHLEESQLDAVGDPQEERVSILNDSINSPTPSGAHAP